MRFNKLSIALAVLLPSCSEPEPPIDDNQEPEPQKQEETIDNWQPAAIFDYDAERTQAPPL